jgi:hypothetical protein
VIFINGMDSALAPVNIIRKFANNAKIGQRVTTLEDKDRLQVALDNLST